MGKLGRDEYVAPTKVSLGEYMRDVWFPYLDDQVEAATLRATTVAQYRSLAETHVIPNLGGMRMRALTPPMLDRLYGELLRSCLLYTSPAESIVVLTGTFRS